MAGQLFYYQPPADKVARGSARSIDGVHITQAIATQADLLEGFGGHPMAAGLAIKNEYIDRFRKGVCEAVKHQKSGEELEPTLDIHAEVKLDELTLELADELELLAPFGPGNPPVNILCRRLQIVGVITIGKDKSHRKLVVQQEHSEGQKEILWWSSIDKEIPPGLVDIVLRIRPGFFREERQLTITLQDIRLSGVRNEQREKPNVLDIVDYRLEADYKEVLTSILGDSPEALVWGEGADLPKYVKGRDQLYKASELVIFTTPPSQDILLSVLNKVQPSKIAVIALDPKLDSTRLFLQRLVGLVKYTLAHYKGCISLEKLATAMASSEKAILAATKLLPSVGLAYSILRDKTICFAQESKQREVPAQESLSYILRESSAFRRKFSESDDLSRYLIVGDADQPG